ncbi:MAG: hypothetical protein ACRDZZ_03255, partial [Ilumatobacteraceae bacterium]
MSQIARRLGGACVALGTIAWAAWLTGRLLAASAHPLWVGVFATEVIAVITGVAVAVLVGVRPHPPMGPDTDGSSPDRGGNDPNWYPTAVASLLRLRVEPDLRAAVRGAWRPAFSRGTPIADRVIALVRFDGTRRLAAIAALAVSLLLGVAPLGDPSPRLLGAAVTGLVLTSLGTMLLTGGVIRPGDRLCWSFASIGLSVGPVERDGAMPVRWAGVMGSIVILNLAVALRGLSDRWTHGLPPMADADRVAAMAAALMFVAGGLVTLRRLQPPEAGQYVATRRLDERSARQTALGAT